MNPTDISLNQTTYEPRFGVFYIPEGWFKLDGGLFWVNMGKESIILKVATGLQRMDNNEFIDTFEIKSVEYDTMRRAFAVIVYSKQLPRLSDLESPIPLKAIYKVLRLQEEVTEK